jgi:chemotaxis protein methyltransferase CheR
MVWSAGCSTGEEPYTLAMLLTEFSRRHPAFKFSIIATDVSEEVISKAKSGIYSHERIEPIPIELRKKYLLKSKDRQKKLVRVIPELRNIIRFFCLNLLTESFYFSEKMDIIFFRNVLIYFDLKTQQLVIERICNQLKEDGYLFIGHSETLNSIKAPLKQVSTSVYKKVQMDFS